MSAQNQQVGDWLKDEPIQDVASNLQGFTRYNTPSGRCLKRDGYDVRTLGDGMVKPTRKVWIDAESAPPSGTRSRTEPMEAHASHSSQKTSNSAGHSDRVLRSHKSRTDSRQDGQEAAKGRGDFVHSSASSLPKDIPTAPKAFSSKTVVKTEPTLDLREVDELADDEEAEMEPPSPPGGKQNAFSSTVLLLRSVHPELADCWSRDESTCQLARNRTMYQVWSELSHKSRKPKQSTWRDDAFAVDWVLDREKGTKYFVYPDWFHQAPDRFETPNIIEEVARRERWEFETVRVWMERHPTFEQIGELRRNANALMLDWKRRAGSQGRSFDGFIGYDKHPSKSKNEVISMPVSTSTPGTNQREPTVNTSLLPSKRKNCHDEGDKIVDSKRSRNNLETSVQSKPPDKCTFISEKSSSAESKGSKKGEEEKNKKKKKKKKKNKLNWKLARAMTVPWYISGPLREGAFRDVATWASCNLTRQTWDSMYSNDNIRALGGFIENQVFDFLTASVIIDFLKRDNSLLLTLIRLYAV